MPKSFSSPRHRGLCELLIEGRKKAGLTQADLAGKLGKRQSYVSKFEIGERRLDIVEVIEIAETLKMSVRSLVDKLLAIGA